MPEVKFAGSIIEIASEVVAKITSVTRNISVTEEDTTGAENTFAGSDVLEQQFVSIAAGQTLNLEGITMEDAGGLDDGQSELRDAAEQGENVTVRHTRNTGHGKELTGFFTAYSETGSTTAVYRFTGTFRVNTVTEITPGS